MNANNYDNNIPKLLKGMPNWVSCKKGVKIPFNTLTGRAASTSDKNTWTTYETAKKSLEHGFTWLGFVFNNMEDIIALDVDNATDEDGFLNSEAIGLIELCKSYTELSQSKKGIHILMRGKMPLQKGANNHSRRVELYNDKRFFILTANIIKYNNIRYNQEAIDYIVKEYFTQDKREKKERVNINKYIDFSPLITNGRIKAKSKEFPTVGEGGRNMFLTSIGGYYHNIINNSELYKKIHEINNKYCSPPLDVMEVDLIWESVTKYEK